jgi:hypothetical protein
MIYTVESPLCGRKIPIYYVPISILTFWHWSMHPGVNPAVLGTVPLNLARHLNRLYCWMSHLSYSSFSHITISNFLLYTKHSRGHIVQGFIVQRSIFIVQVIFKATFIHNSHNHTLTLHTYLYSSSN